MRENEVEPRKGDEEDAGPPLCDVCRKARAKYRGRDGTHYCDACKGDEDVVLIAAGMAALDLTDGESDLLGLL
jgi:hypothetical protein